MARKYDLISELYERTCFAVTNNPLNWQSFLKTAGRNYRLRFDEQLLIYAQRPEATAVLEIERWNDTFGRWVNKGAKGIAVFEDADRSRQRLIHYFDISDTHESRYSRPVPIWEMKPQYENEVIETLENTFGSVNDSSDIESVIKESIANAVEDNITDYISDFMNLGAGSDIEYLSAEEANLLYSNLVKNSVIYMVMARLGLDADKVYSPQDFAGIENFNSTEILNAVGIATSDIAEMALLPISKTIGTLNKENRIIETSASFEYNKGENQTERSFDDERNHIHEARRLLYSRLDITGTAEGDSRQMVADEENLSETAPQNPVLQSSDKRDFEQSLGRGSAKGNRTGENFGRTDVSESGFDGTDESGRYDEMGGIDEQHQELGTGNREGTDNLRLEYYDRQHEDNSLPFFGKDDTIREILGTTPHLRASKEEIKDFFEKNAESAIRTEYIKSIFNNDYTELTLEDGRTVGYKTFQNVLHLWEGNYENRTAQSFYDWDVIAQHFEAMRLLGELTDEIKPLPSIEGQLSLIQSSQAEEKKTSAFTFSQEIIDAVLTRGSGISEGKMRIYEQFEKSLSAKENTDFLKNEYGWGGSYPVIIGSGIDENHDGKGITISKGFSEDSPSVTLSWSQVEKRIGELIRADRYLNPKEKEQYLRWLEKEEARRTEVEEQKRNREILSTAPLGEAEQSDNDDIIGKEVIIDDRRFVIEKVGKISGDVSMRDVTFEDSVGFPINRVEKIDYVRSLLAKQSGKEDELNTQYEYHLGDTVYIGASEYEILSFDENRVMLYDTEMPLFNKEFTREEFDRKVRENPLNDHLRVTSLPAEEKAVTEKNISKNSTKTEQNFTPVTSYKDAFFLDDEKESVTWMYYNPDSNAGGQYVTNTLSYDDVVQAARQYESAGDFFDYLGSIAKQELADVGTEWFTQAEEQFNKTPEFTDCTNATMEAITKRAKKKWLHLLQNEPRKFEVVMSIPALTIC